MLCPGTRNFVRVERSRHIFAILRNDYNIRVQQAAGIGWIEGSLFRKTGDQDPGHRDQRFRHPFRHPVLPEEDTGAALPRLFTAMVRFMDYHPAIAAAQHL